VKVNVIQIGFSFSQAIMLSIGGLALFTYIGYFFGLIPNYRYIGLLFVLIAGIITFSALLQIEKKLLKAFLNTLGLLSLLLIFVFLFGSLVETFPDGMTAHLEGVALMREGWNPVLDVGYQGMPHAVASATQDNYLRLVAGRSSYIFFCILSGIFDVNEGGRSLALIVAIIIWFYFINTFTTDIKQKAIFLLGVYGNPIVIGFLYSHYLDHILFLFTILFVLVLHRSFLNQKLADLLVLFVVSWALVGTKASGLTILFSIVAAYAILSLVYANFFIPNKQLNINDRIFLLALPLLAGSLGAASPYAMNLFLYGDPFVFFRQYGGVSEAINIVWGPQVNWFNETGAFKRLFQSVFSEMAGNPDKVPNYKLPIQITKQELIHIFKLNSDSRIGAFGPLFGASVLIATPLAIFCILKDRKLNISILCAFVLLAITLQNPYAFWARFVPFLWLFPLLITVGSWSLRRILFIRWLCYAVVAVMTLNTLIYFSIFNAGYLRAQSIITTQIAALSTINAPKIYFANYVSYELLLSERGVNFIKVGKCNKILFRIHRSGVDVCK